jgi:hypothetical protein
VAVVAAGSADCVLVGGDGDDQVIGGDVLVGRRHGHDGPRRSAG